MSQPADKKLFIGNIIHLDIKILMNTVKMIDRSAGFYPDKSKKFGFIHISTPEKCNEIYEKLLNCSYNGSYIHVERPKAYVEPKIEPKVLRPSPFIKSSVNYTYPKSNFYDVRKIDMEARRMEIDESNRIRDMMEMEKQKVKEKENEKVTTNYEYEDVLFAKVFNANINGHIKEIDENDPRYDAFIDSFFAPNTALITAPKRVIYNPEMDW